MSDTKFSTDSLVSGLNLSDSAWREQLYRYAEDIEQCIEKCEVLETRNKELRDTCNWLQESRRELDELVRCSHDIHFVTDVAGTIFLSNSAASSLAPVQRLAGSNLSEWVMPDSLENFHQIRIRALNESQDSDSEWELHLYHRADDLSQLIVAVRGFALYRNGEVNSLHWVMRNITYLRENEFDNQISTLVFKGATEGVMITDLDGEIIAVNPAFTLITGYGAEEAIGRNVNFLNSGVQDEAFYSKFWATLRENGSWQGELFNRRKNGEMYPEWVNVNAAHGSGGQVLSYVVMFSDISRQMRAEQRLAYLAHYDALTALPNRHLFDDRLAQVLAVGKRSRTPFTLMFIDLDHFKEVNDLFGHHTGDRMLHEVARRFQKAVRAVDTVARLGGDEFVVIAPEMNGAAAIDVFSNKILAAIAEPFVLDGKTLRIGCSLGCAQYPIDGEDEITLLRLADQAMYAAKAAGGNCYVIHQGGRPPVDSEES